MKSLCKKPGNELKIHKVSECYNTKYKTTLSDWTISGYVNLFNIHKRLNDLVKKMSEHLPQNSKPQISLVISNSNHILFY